MGTADCCTPSAEPLRVFWPCCSRRERCAGRGTAGSPPSLAAAMVMNLLRVVLGALVALVLVQGASSTSLHMEIYELVCFLVGGSNSCATNTCPAGLVKRPRPSHKPRPNGCGTEGMAVNLTRFDFVPCCNLHDLCYSSCTLSKAQCDRAFLTCMRAQCDEETQGGSRQVRDRCVHDARMYHGAVFGFGCGPYRRAQNKACECGVASPQERWMMMHDHISYYERPSAGLPTAAYASLPAHHHLFATTTVPELSRLNVSRDDSTLPSEVRREAFVQ